VGDEPSLLFVLTRRLLTLRPSSYHPRRYGDLLKYLVEEELVIPLGLSRGIDQSKGVGVNGNLRPYIFTNPK
jgi:hypothetical protein